MRTKAILSLDDINTQISNFLSIISQTSRNGDIFTPCHNIVTVTLYLLKCNNSFNEIEDVILK